MSETFPTPPENEPYEVTVDKVANLPQKGDTIIRNPGTEDEIKYTVTFVGKDSTLVAANEYKTLDVVKFTYTLRGGTMDYTRTKDQFAREIKSLPSQVDIVKCFRKY